MRLLKNARSRWPDARRLAALLAVGSVVAGCAVASPHDDLSTVSFAPEVEVDWAALTTHPRGFAYRDIVVGNGATANAGSRVRVSYVVRLADGREMDRAEPESPMPFRVGEGTVIAALDAGVRGMRVGGTRQLVVPPRLGYGARGAGPVPPNAVLVMMVTLEGVE